MWLRKWTKQKFKTLAAGSKMLSRARLWTEFVLKRQWLLKFWWRLEFNSTISHTFVLLTGWKLQGKVSQRCWSCPSSRQWSNNSTKKKAYDCRSTGASLDALKYGQKRCIGWIEGHGLFYYLWGKALTTTWRIRGVCYDSMGRNNTVIRAGKK